MFVVSMLIVKIWILELILKLIWICQLNQFSLQLKCCMLYFWGRFHVCRCRGDEIIIFTGKCYYVELNWLIMLVH